MISWYICSICIVSATPKNSRAARTPSTSASTSSGVLYSANDRPHGGGDPEPAVQRPGAVVADPDRDAAVVEHLADVVRVHAVDHERHRTAAVARASVRPDDPDPGHLREPVQRQPVSASSCAATASIPMPVR